MPANVALGMLKVKGKHACAVQQAYTAMQHAQVIIVCASVQVWLLQCYDCKSPCQSSHGMNALQRPLEHLQLESCMAINPASEPERLGR